MSGLKAIRASGKVEMDLLPVNKAVNVGIMLARANTDTIKTDNNKKSRDFLFFIRKCKLYYLCVKVIVLIILIEFLTQIN